MLFRSSGPHPAPSLYPPFSLPCFLQPAALGTLSAPDDPAARSPSAEPRTRPLQEPSSPGADPDAPRQQAKPAPPRPTPTTPEPKSRDRSFFIALMELQASVSPPHYLPPLKPTTSMAMKTPTAPLSPRRPLFSLPSLYKYVELLSLPLPYPSSPPFSLSPSSLFEPLPSSPEFATPSPEPVELAGATPPVVPSLRLDARPSRSPFVARLKTTQKNFMYF